MAKGYSEDLRERVVRYVESGKSKTSAAALFAVGLATVNRWCARWQERGTVAADRPGRPCGHGVLRQDAVLSYVDRNQDATLQEVGQHFKVSHVAIWKRLRRAGYTYKKNDAVRRKG